MRRALAFIVLACGCSSSPAAPVDAGPPTWGTSLANTDGALLSVWGTSSSNVIAVGGPLGNAGIDTLVMHWDGRAWTRMTPGGTETYWWVHGSSANDVWMVGENGRITHWDGTAFAEHGFATTATLFGVWAGAPNDAWAVGGTPEGGTAQPNDLLLHWDGASWSKMDLPQALGRALFKVWGTSSENLYAVGEAGTIWHRTGGAWALEPSGAHGTLLTVFGCSATEVYAVGGRDVLRSDGATWSPVTDVMLTNDVNGVSCAKPGAVVIVGFGGAKQRLVNGTWVDDFGQEPFADLHGAWADPDGGYWAAGGNFVARPAAGMSRGGLVARFSSQ